VRPPRHRQARAGAFLYDAGDFDAQFFGISPREAAGDDPSSGLLLETSWKRSRTPDRPGLAAASSTGVFTGLIHHDYGRGAAMPTRSRAI